MFSGLLPFLLRLFDFVSWSCVQNFGQSFIGTIQELFGSVTKVLSENLLRYRLVVATEGSTER